MATRLYWLQANCTDPTFGLLFKNPDIDVSGIRKQLSLVINTKVGGLKELHDRALYGTRLDGLGNR